MTAFNLQTEIKPLPATDCNISDSARCGPSSHPPSEPHDKAGYRVCSFVDRFHNTQVGAVPCVKTELTIVDLLGTVRVRLGINRNQYKIPPGLYCTGTPDSNAPVLLTANYKLSFDNLRKNLTGLDCWIIVLDTRGVNVWCAAGKKTFSTSEIIRQINRTEIQKLVTHRQLILPQLGAPGVSALQVRKNTGFKVLYGPIRAIDIKKFLHNNKKATPDMRKVTFSLPERLVLIPLEIAFMLRTSCILLCGLFFLSGISQNIFSIHQAWDRWLIISSAYGAGLLSGTVLVPALLPWIPGKSFYIKGLLTGLIAVTLLLLHLFNTISPLEKIAIASGILTLSSYTAMNFTGATPFTSPSGVEKEMRRGIPLQIIGFILCLTTWTIAPFFQETIKI